MDSFLRRLKYYGIGFGIGMVFVFFFFQNRGCSWLPSNRVKNSILERVLVISEDENVVLKDKNLTKKDIVNALNNGSVDFGESKKHGKLKVYQVDFEKNEKSIKLFFTLPEESFICEVNLSAKNAHKVYNTKEGKGNVLRFPNEKNLIFVDTLASLSCQLKEMKFENNSKLFQNWKQFVQIDFQKSQLSMSPKPEHYFEFKDKKGNLIGSKSIWYKNKINISSFVLPYESECK
ncbi:MAG: hypothetical protein V4638_08745 [Bacteroidota bacterium]